MKHAGPHKKPTADSWAIWFVVVLLVIAAGIFFGGVFNGPAPCKHLIGFHQQRDGTLTNVYGPCLPYCNGDPKECG